MVNPVKAFNRATGLSNVLTERGTAANTEALRLSGQAPPTTATQTQVAAPPDPAPVFGQDPAPKKSSKKPRSFAPAIIGTAGATADAGGGGKTLLGQ